MAEDLLDQWVKIIRPIFPSNAWIVSELSREDYIILIDWNIENNEKQGGKRSRKIKIVIKEDAINGYLGKNVQDRESYNTTLKQLMNERYDQFYEYNTPDTYNSLAVEKWLVTKEFMDQCENRIEVNMNQQISLD
jgi:hypothetical protein